MKIKVQDLATKYTLSPKEVIAKLVEAGIEAKRRNSSVDLEAATKVLGGTVTALPPRAERKLKEFYAKYTHVVAGSVREPTAEDRANLDHCHGKVCDITCVDTGELRTINVQDAFQVKRTPEAQAQYMRKRRAERRKAKKAAAAAKAS